MKNIALFIAFNLVFNTVAMAQDKDEVRKPIQSWSGVVNKVQDTFSGDGDTSKDVDESGDVTLGVNLSDVWDSGGSSKDDDARNSAGYCRETLKLLADGNHTGSQIMAMQNNPLRKKAYEAFLKVQHDLKLSNAGEITEKDCAAVARAAVGIDKLYTDAVNNYVVKMTIEGMNKAENSGSFEIDVTSNNTSSEAAANSPCSGSQDGQPGAYQEGLDAESCNELGKTMYADQMAESDVLSVMNLINVSTMVTDMKGEKDACNECLLKFYQNASEQKRKTKKSFDRDKDIQQERLSDKLAEMALKKNMLKLSANIEQYAKFESIYGGKMDLAIQADIPPRGPGKIAIYASENGSFGLGQEHGLSDATHSGPTIIGIDGTLAESDIADNSKMDDDFFKSQDSDDETAAENFSVLLDDGTRSTTKAQAYVGYARNRLSCTDSEAILAKLKTKCGDKTNVFNKARKRIKKSLKSLGAGNENSGMNLDQLLKSYKKGVSSSYNGRCDVKVARMQLQKTHDAVKNKKSINQKSFLSDLIDQSLRGDSKIRDEMAKGCKDRKPGSTPLKNILKNITISAFSDAGTNDDTNKLRDLFNYKQGKKQQAALKDLGFEGESISFLSKQTFDMTISTNKKISDLVEKNFTNQLQELFVLSAMDDPSFSTMVNDWGSFCNFAETKTDSDKTADYVKFGKDLDPKSDEYAQAVLDRYTEKADANCGAIYEEMTDVACMSGDDFSGKFPPADIAKAAEEISKELDKAHPKTSMLNKHKFALGATTCAELQPKTSDEAKEKLYTDFSNLKDIAFLNRSSFMNNLTGFANYDSFNDYKKNVVCDEDSVESEEKTARIVINNRMFGQEITIKDVQSSEDNSNKFGEKNHEAHMLAQSSAKKGNQIYVNKGLIDNASLDAAMEKERSASHSGQEDNVNRINSSGPSLIGIDGTLAESDIADNSKMDDDFFKSQDSDDETAASMNSISNVDSLMSGPSSDSNTSGGVTMGPVFEDNSDNDTAEKLNLDAVAAQAKAEQARRDVMAKLGGIEGVDFDDLGNLSTSKLQALLAAATSAKDKELDALKKERDAALAKVKDLEMKTIQDKLAKAEQERESLKKELETFKAKSGFTPSKEVSSVAVASSDGVGRTAVQSAVKRAGGSVAESAVRAPSGGFTPRTFPKTEAKTNSSTRGLVLKRNVEGAGKESGEINKIFSSYLNDMMGKMGSNVFDEIVLEKFEGKIKHVIVAGQKIDASKLDLETIALLETYMGKVDAHKGNVDKLGKIEEEVHTAERKLASLEDDAYNVAYANMLEQFASSKEQK